MGEPLETLWAVTSGLCAQNEDRRWIRDAVAENQQTVAAQTVERLNDELVVRLKTIVEQSVGPNDPAVKMLAAYGDLLEAEDKKFMNDLKLALRVGVQVFEELERDTIRQGSDQLLVAARAIPKLLEGYYDRVISGIQALEESNRGG